MSGNPPPPFQVGQVVRYELFNLHREDIVVHFARIIRLQYIVTNAAYIYELELYNVEKTRVFEVNTFFFWTGNDGLEDLERVKDWPIEERRCFYKGYMAQAKWNVDHASSQNAPEAVVEVAEPVQQDNSQMALTLLNIEKKLDTLLSRGHP